MRVFKTHYFGSVSLTDILGTYVILFIHGYATNKIDASLSNICLIEYLSLS